MAYKRRINEQMDKVCGFTGHPDGGGSQASLFPEYCLWWTMLDHPSHPGNSPVSNGYLMSSFSSWCLLGANWLLHSFTGWLSLPRNLCGHPVWPCEPDSPVIWSLPKGSLLWFLLPFFLAGHNYWLWVEETIPELQGNRCLSEYSCWQLTLPRRAEVKPWLKGTPVPLSGHHGRFSGFHGAMGGILSSYSLLRDSGCCWETMKWGINEGDCLV